MAMFIRKILCLLCLIPCFCAAQSTPLNDQERAELELFRERVPELRRQLHEAQMSTSDSANVRTARENYLIAYFSSEAALFEAKARVFAWQIFAANAILALVALLSVSGILFAGYQLWQSARHPKIGPASIEMEISLQKFRLQSGVIGIAVLAFSGLFLVLFLKEVYRVELVPLTSGATAVQRSEN